MNDLRDGLSVLVMCLLAGRLEEFNDWAIVGGNRGGVLKEVMIANKDAGTSACSSIFVSCHNQGLSIGDCSPVAPPNQNTT